MVMELITRNLSTKDVLTEVNTDELAMIANSKQQLQEASEGVDGGVQEVWTENAPREDMCGIGWTANSSTSGPSGWR